jgi:uncharacterized protein (TIGR02646 family)
MRGLTRLPEPQILIERGSTWTNDFINSTKTRPDSSKYGHEKIRIQLATMSFHKCFYCESKLKLEPKEVDHHVEVSIQKNLAFHWENLYLSCDNCNNKISHDAIPINTALDPCRNNDAEIQLKNFHKVLIQILRKQNAEGRKDLNEIDLKILNFFKQADQPYSLMFKVLLDKLQQ